MSKKTQTLVQEGKSVLLGEESTVYLIDMSSSMAEFLGDYKGFPLKKDEAVVKALSAMMEARLSYPTADRVAIVVFSTAYESRSMSPVVVNLGPCSSKHVSKIVKLYGSGCTPMYQGLEKAARVLAEAEGLVRIVMMSDGEPNEGYSKSEILALGLKLSKQYGFIIDTIGIGIPGKTSCYDERFLKTLAHNGAGQFFPIEDVDALVKLLRQTAIERRTLIGSGIKLLGDGLMAV